MKVGRPPKEDKKKGLWIHTRYWTCRGRDTVEKDKKEIMQKGSRKHVGQRLSFSTLKWNTVSLHAIP